MTTNLLDRAREWPFVSPFIAAPKVSSGLLAFALFFLWLIFGGINTVQEVELQPPEREMFAEVLVEHHGREAGFYLDEDRIFSARQTECYGYSSKMFDDCAVHVYQESADVEPDYYLCPRPPEDELKCLLMEPPAHAISHMAKNLGFIEKRLASGG